MRGRAVRRLSPRARHWLLYGGLVGAVGIILAGGAWLASASAAPSPAIAAGSFVLIAFGCAVVWLWLERVSLQPAETLARELDLLMHANREHALCAPEGHALGRLPDSVVRLAQLWQMAEAERAAALSEASARADEQRARLEAILRDLSDGVIGCSADRRILLFNEAARRILGAGAALGLDRPLDRLIARAPLAQAFDLLCDRQRRGEPLGAVREAFVCATADGARLLRARMTLIAGDGSGVSGFVLEFSDATDRLRQAEQRDAGLEQAIEALRAPVAALAAATEVLAGKPPPDQGRRQAFLEAIVQESALLVRRLEELAQAARAPAIRDWPMDDLHSSDLVRRVNRLVGGPAGDLSLTEVGPGLWLQGDAYHLALLLEHLMLRIRAAAGSASFDLEAHRGTRRVNLDLVWDGHPLPLGTLRPWWEEELASGHGGARIRDVLRRHDSDLWSRPHARPGRAVLRIPLPAPERPQIGEGAREQPPLPPRPEFYDFDLLTQGRHEPLLERRLAELSYVVFDTETTGLDPRGNDRIVQIAAVRIVNRRLLTGDAFDRLVDPGRPIPATSTRFHGITDGMVRGRPPIQVVLPDFFAFVGDAVLVAHNAAFDLAFLRRDAGTMLGQPVLDTLLLSAVLHDHVRDHSLDAIAARFGVALAERHRALGDAIGTAQLFLRMLDLLEADGITTLGAALRASGRAGALRRRQAKAFGSAGSSRAREIQAIWDG